MPLTPRQLEVLDFVVAFIRDHRYAPTLKEMADEFDLSRVTVLQHLNALEEKGYIERESNRARGITVTKQVDVPDSSLEEPQQLLMRDSSGSETYTSSEEGEETRRADRQALPLIGHLSDQASVRTREEPMFLPVEELIPSADDGFLLDVRSDQLVGLSILEGDRLVVDRSKTGTDGDLVLVEHDDTCRLAKRMEGDSSSTLEPIGETGENPLDPAEPGVRIKGTVTGVIRTYAD